MKVHKWKFAVAVLAIALFAAWYAFRPEGLIIDRRVHEEFPLTRDGSVAETLASGTFHSVVHPTEGMATVYHLGNGDRVLRLTNLKTTNGPNVHVYMVAADDAKDNASVRHPGFIDLGQIKGNVGDQNYALGRNVDLSKYRAVSLWCKRFSLDFGAAPLTPEGVMSHK